jgi:hypothetical protein
MLIDFSYLLASRESRRDRHSASLARERSKKFHSYQVTAFSKCLAESGIPMAW